MPISHIEVFLAKETVDSEEISYLCKQGLKKFRLVRRTESNGIL